MDEQRLAEIEARHKDRVYDECGRRWPCDAMVLITEVRRLQAELTRIKQAAATEALFEEGDAEAIAMLRRGFTGRPDTHIPEPQKD